MMKPVVVGLVLLITGCATGDRVATDRATAVEMLSRADPPGLVWRHSQRIDINCDKSDDDVFITQDEHRFYVGVVLAPPAINRYSIVAFSLHGDYQESFCGEFESLTPEPLDHSMADATGEEELGYVVAPGCHGLQLRAGECDSFHLYWNRMSDALDWWRL